MMLVMRDINMDLARWMQFYDPSLQRFPRSGAAAVDRAVYLYEWKKRFIFRGVGFAFNIHRRNPFHELLFLRQCLCPHLLIFCQIPR